MDRELFPDYDKLAERDLFELRNLLVHATNHKALLEGVLKSISTAIKGEATYWEEIAHAIAESIKFKSPHALIDKLGEDDWQEAVRDIVPLYKAGRHLVGAFDSAESKLQVIMENQEEKIREQAVKMARDLRDAGIVPGSIAATPISKGAKA